MEKMKRETAKKSINNRAIEAADVLLEYIVQIRKLRSLKVIVKDGQLLETYPPSTEDCNADLLDLAQAMIKRLSSCLEGVSDAI